MQQVAILVRVLLVDLVGTCVDQGAWCIVLVILVELWIFGSQHACEFLLPCAETVQGTGGHGAAEERTQFVHADRGPPLQNFDVPEVCAAQAKVYLWHRPTVPSVHPKRTTYCKNRKWTSNVDAVLNSTPCTRFYTRFTWWQHYEHRKRYSHNTASQVLWHHQRNATIVVLAYHGDFCGSLRKSKFVPVSAFRYH